MLHLIAAWMEREKSATLNWEKPGFKQKKKEKKEKNK